MKYEVKTTTTYVNEDGVMKKTKVTYLAEQCINIGEAWKKARTMLDMMDEDANEVRTITESRLKEICNPAYKEQHDEAEGWTVYLERSYFDDGMKVKKQRYAVLCWSNEIPSETSGELDTYLKQIDPDRNEFKVVKISKSPIIGVI